MQWSLLIAVSVLAVTSRMLFLKARGARIKSIWANRSGVQGAVNPSVVLQEGLGHVGSHGQKRDYQRIDFPFH